MSKQLIVDVIREVVRGLTIEEVQKIAARMPIDVEEGGKKFCRRYLLGDWFKAQMILHDVSVAYELYEFISSSQSAVQTKEVEASGESKNATT